jgi:hypothetical protein
MSFVHNLAHAGKPPLGLDLPPMLKPVAQGLTTGEVSQFGLMSNAQFQLPLNHTFYTYD